MPRITGCESHLSRSGAKIPLARGSCLTIGCGVRSWAWFRPDVRLARRPRTPDPGVVRPRSKVVSFTPSQQGHRRTTLRTLTSSAAPTLCDQQRREYE
jgi:hypothetical protein